MATRLEDLVLRITADSRQLQSELSKVTSGSSRAAARVSSDWKNAGTGIQKALGALTKIAGIAGIGGGLSFAGIKSLADDALKTADSLDRVSKVLGISTTALQEWRFAAGQAGIEQGQLDGALQTLAKNLGETASGTGRARTAFEGLKIDARNASGDVRGVADVFEELIGKLARMESEAARSAFSRRLLGGSGPAIAAFSGDLGELIQLARDLGIAIDEDVVNSLAATEDKMSALSAVMDQRMSPALDMFSKGIAGAKERLVGFVETIVDAINRSDSLRAAFERFTPIDLLGSVEEVDRQSAEASARIESLKSQIETFRRINPGQPEVVLDRALGPIYKKLAAETARMEALWAQRNSLLSVGSPSAAVADPIRVSATALATKKKDPAIAAAAREEAAAIGRLNAVITASQSPAERLIANLDELGADLRAGRIDADEYADGQEAIARSLGEIEEKDAAAGLREVNQIIEAGLTPAERLLAQLDAMGQAYASTAIDAEQFAAVQDSIEKQLAAIEPELSAGMKAIEQVGRGVFEGLTGALSDFILTGKSGFAELATSFASEFLQMGIKAGVSSLFGSIFGGAGAVSGIAGIPALAGGGPVSAGMPYLVGENGPELLVPRSSGFIVPNSGARRGGAMAASSASMASPVFVTVNNSSKAAVGVEQKSGPGGQREIEILIEDVVAKSVSRGGVVGKAIDGRLRVRPRGV
jgi:Lambda phage tail tape-measure protein (Tape_meas_lam_C)